MLRKFILMLIKCYRYCISPLLGNRCRFYPSCSCYAHEAIENHGIIKGSYLSIKRLGKCHPWHPGGYDPVPESNTKQNTNTTLQKQTTN